MSAVPSPAPGDTHHEHVARLLSPGLAATLAQFATPDLLQQGKVTVLGLEAIIERFGPRWPARREAVHEHIATVLDRHLGAGAYHKSISERDVLVCQPDLSRLAGQANCLRLLEEIFTHFLGEATQANLALHQVESVTPEGVFARRVDAAEARAGAAKEGAYGTSSVGGVYPSDGPESRLGQINQWTPFATSAGNSVKVGSVLEPVISLRDHRTIALRLSSKVAHLQSGKPLTHSEIARLSTRDHLRVDMASIVGGLLGVRKEHPQARPPALIVGASLTSLSSAEGRARIITALKEAKAHVAGGIICELRDLAGAPFGQVSTAFAAVQPCSLMVIGHIGDSLEAARSLGALPLRAVSVDAPPCLAPARFQGWMAAAANSTKSLRKSLLVYGLANANQARLALRLGATHASIAATSDSTPLPWQIHDATRALD